METQTEEKVILNRWGKPRFLRCSRGCRFDTRQMWYQHLTPGDRCPNTLTYDLMSGSTYCRRILKVQNG